MIALERFAATMLRSSFRGGCKFKCYIEDDFISHLNQEHRKCGKYCCYICQEYFAQPKDLIYHLADHNINTYQCIFCLFGTLNRDFMVQHLAMEHFEYEPFCLERSHVLPSDIYNGEEIGNLKIIRLEKDVEKCLVKPVALTPAAKSYAILPKRTKKRRAACPDVLSAAIKSAKIHETNQPSDTIVITVPDRAQMTNNSTLTSTSPIDSEFIILDDENQNDMQETFEIKNIWAGAKNDENTLQKTNDNDVIVIDDDDDDNNDNDMLDNNIPIKQKHSISVIDEPNKPKRLALPMIALDKLFFCKDCDKVFSNGNDYYTHFNHCPFWNSNGKKCAFCSKVFKTTLNMTEHIKLHGPDRFKCYLCKVNVPSLRAITHHMKVNHSILKLDFEPVIPGLANTDKDEFIVYDEETKKSKDETYFTCGECSIKDSCRNIIILHMKSVHNINPNEIYADDLLLINDKYTREYQVKKIEFPQQQLMSPKKKRSSNFGNKKGSSKIKGDKTKGLFFSPDTIESIPIMHIFSEPIGCSLCSYNTKVRSNLIIHLHGHEKGQDNTKEIVNPVPSIGKSELMFDKMINLSASSFEAMHTEKMKIDELSKKIVEVAPRDKLNMELFPGFFPKNIRYKCSVPSCSYIGMTVDMLKKHISILHPDSQCYICPHCTPSSILSKRIDFNKIEFHLMHHGENLYSCQYCNYIDFNRIEMRTHMINAHLSQITTANQSNIIVIRQTMLEDDCLDRLKPGRSTMEWVCNICSSGIKYTENEIQKHILMAHKVSEMYKCPMCQFENKDDNPKIFEEHYKFKHPSVAVKCLRVYEKIAEINEQLMQTNQLPSTSYILEQQALESIEPTIVPPTCRGIPIDSIPTVKNCNKSRGVTKSPKAAAKNSPNQARKQLILPDTFSKDDNLGAISSIGLFTCPRCNVFETMSKEYFREHLYKDVNYKTWKCMKCFEISDSPKKMAWHVKKHGNGSKYEKIEDDEKLKWVERVLVHQNSQLNEFHKQNKEKHMRESLELKSGASDRKTLSSPCKKKNIGKDKKGYSETIPQVKDVIISLLDDSDDE